MKKKCLNFGFELLLFAVGIAFMHWTIQSYEMFSDYQNTMHIAFLLIYSFLFFIVPNKWNGLVFLLYNSVFYLYYVAQYIYFVAFGQYFRLTLALSLSSEVAGAATSVQEFIRPEHLLPFGVLIGVFLVYELISFFWLKEHFKYRYRLIVSCGAIFTAVFFMNSIFNRIELSKDSQDAFLIYKTDYYIYNSMPSTVQFVETFGLSNLFVKDVQTLMIKSSDASEYEQEIKDYLSSQKKHQSNEMTGIFKGKNLVFIQAESLTNCGIDETLTPTLYQMMSEGITVKGYNSPLMDGSTSSTEFMANVGIYPITDDGYNITFKCINHTFDTTIAKLFSNDGYVSYGFHNGFGEYYSRDIMFPNYGYDFFDSFRLGVEDGAADSKVLNIAKWIFMETDPFFAFWVTYNGHQPYNLDLKPEIFAFVEEIQNTYPTLSEEYVSFMAKNMDLDRSLKDLMDNLSYSQKLDDTVFVIFGDHFAKGISDDKQVEAALNAMGNDADEEAVERGKKTPLIIYSTSLDTPLVYEKVSNTCDLLPTICNLFGIYVDETTILGNDIFDPEYEGFCFDSTNTYETDWFVYNYVKDVFNQIDEDRNEEEARFVIQDLMKRFEISKWILKMDYFSLY